MKVKLDLKKNFLVFCFLIAILILITNKLNIGTLEWDFKSNFGFLNENDISNSVIRNYSNENEEWELIDDNIFISKSLSFYFVDDGIISSIMISRNTLKVNLFCLVKVLKGNNQYSYVIKAKIYPLETQDHSSYRLDCYFPQFKNMDLSEVIDYDFKLNVLIKNFGIERTKRSIQLKLKSKIKNKTRHDTVLCGPLIYLNSKDDYENFALWLNYNVKMGYQKIIIYVILVENEELFNQLIMKYKDIVEIRPYQYIPNVNYLNTDDKNPYMTPEVYIKSKTEWSHWVKHRAIINGCFLSCVKDFDRVAVFDIDELIVPHSGEIKSFEGDDEFSLAKLEDVKCEYNINNYMDNFNTKNFKKNSLPRISYRFYNSYYLDALFIKSIFFYLKLNSSHTTQFEKSFHIPIHQNGKFYFSILNEKDFSYLKFLIHFYDNYYMNNYLLTNSSKNIFKRIWMIQETVRTEFGFGKVYDKTFQ